MPASRFPARDRDMGPGRVMFRARRSQWGAETSWEHHGWPGSRQGRLLRYRTINSIPTPAPATKLSGPTAPNKLPLQLPTPSTRGSVNLAPIQSTCAHNVATL
ncbi:hypothetical protein BKA66DRAFT_467548 [Pyrenochaeta sp. MPI-SDFR-AT-0127]|nr:hypothetical protein BKA66DRAFT_467548 [Pyrenochaeta sp. MPI-SDFR-AT-0127]